MKTNENKHEISKVINYYEQLSTDSKYLSKMLMVFLKKMDDIKDSIQNVKEIDSVDIILKPVKNRTMKESNLIYFSSAGGNTNE